MIRRLLITPSGLIGVLASLFLLGSAGLSVVWTPYDPLAVDATNSWHPWSLAHPLGTDSMGRDQLSRLLAGAQVTLMVTVVSTVIALILGLLVAFALALAPGMLGAALQRAVDIAIAFPTLIVAIILVTGFGASTWVAAWAIGLGASVIIARTILPELKRALASDYVLLATTGGAGRWWIITRHALPNIVSTLVIRVTQVMAVAALTEAGLSYLGFGTPPPTPSWGRSLSDLQSQIMVRPEVLIAPSLAITVVVLGFNLLGDALRDIFDPKNRPTQNQTEHDSSMHTDESTSRPRRKEATK